MHLFYVLRLTLSQDVRNYVSALVEGRLLRRLVCSLAFHGEGKAARVLGFLDRFAGTRFLPRAQNHVLRNISKGAMSCHPWSESWVRLGQWLGAVGVDPAGSDFWGAALGREASRQLDRGIRLVMGREDAVLRLFQVAKSAGRMCLYDLPTPHYATRREIMATELAEFPQASVSYDCRAEYTRRRLRRKDQEALLADHIVVASPFVRSSLQKIGIPEKRITIIPYGCAPSTRLARATPTRKPIVLCTGRLSLQKGTLRLLRVWKRLGAHRTHTLRLIGKPLLPAAAFADFAGLYEHIPSLPWSELSLHYATARVFVFPSAADGFGLVMNEALSYGLPVIASTHTGAPGFITQGQEGLIYPHGDDAALGAVLDRLLSRPAETAEMGRAAYDLAQRWTWDHYRAAFRNLVMEILSKQR